MINSDDKVEKIKVNILPYIGVLESIAKEHQELMERAQKEGLDSNFIGHIVKLNKSWPEVDFCEVAEVAFRWYNALSPDDKDWMGYNPELIKIGYDLVTDETVFVWRLNID